MKRIIENVIYLQGQSFENVTSWTLKTEWRYNHGIYLNKKNVKICYRGQRFENVTIMTAWLRNIFILKNIYNFKI